MENTGGGDSVLGPRGARSVGRGGLGLRKDPKVIDAGRGAGTACWPLPRQGTASSPGRYSPIPLSATRRHVSAQVLRVVLGHAGEVDRLSPRNRRLALCPELPIGMASICSPGEHITAHWRCSRCATPHPEHPVGRDSSRSLYHPSDTLILCSTCGRCPAHFNHPSPDLTAVQLPMTLLPRH